MNSTAAIKKSNPQSRKAKTVNICITAVMAALATVIFMVIPDIPIVPGVEYMKIDLSDIPAILTGVLVGPFWGFAVEVIKNLIHLTRTTTYGIGELMNIGVGATIIFTLIGFNKLFSRIMKKDYFSAAPYFAASAVTVGCTILSGWILNGALTPVFFKLAGIPITSAGIMAGVWGSTLLNTVKGALNIIPLYPVYKIVLKNLKKNNY